MPEYIVVRCVSCRIHQAIQMNQKRKFVCKLCSTAQSIKGIYSSASSGRELRSVVQELNMKLQAEDEARLLERTTTKVAAAATAPTLPCAADAAPQAPRWARFCDEVPAAPLAQAAAQTSSSHRVAVPPPEEERCTTTFDDPVCGFAKGPRGKGGGKGRKGGKGGKGREARQKGRQAEHEEEEAEASFKRPRHHLDVEPRLADEGMLFSGVGAGGKFQGRCAEKPVASACRTSMSSALPSGKESVWARFSEHTSSTEDVSRRVQEASSQQHRSGAELSSGGSFHVAVDNGTMLIDVPSSSAGQSTGWARFSEHRQTPQDSAGSRLASTCTGRTLETAQVGSSWARFLSRG